MMHLARFAGLDDEADRGAQAAADQMMMHGRRREQRRNRNAIRPDHAVGQDDDVIAAVHRLLGALAEAVQRLAHAGGAGRGVIGDVERLGVEAVLDMADAADLLEILIGEDRLAHLEPLLLRRALVIENVRARADEGDEAHHQFFADRIDRRIGHLREVLLEIGVEQLRLVGERRDRRIRAHGADRLLAGDGHGDEQQIELLLRIAEGLLAIEQRHIGARGARLDGLQILEHDLRALEPLLIGMRGGELLLDLVVGDDASLLEIDEQHLARLQAPFL